jgi:hypothetical protein
MRVSVGSESLTVRSSVVGVVSTRYITCAYKKKTDEFLGRAIHIRYATFGKIVLGTRHQVNYIYQPILREHSEGMHKNSRY